jgi:hypothetical protein
MDKLLFVPADIFDLVANYLCQLVPKQDELPY